MIKILKRPFIWAVLYSLVLVISVTFVLLDTFVIPRAGIPVNNASSTNASSVSNSSLNSNSSSVSTANSNLLLSQTETDENTQDSIDDGSSSGSTGSSGSKSSSSKSTSSSSLSSSSTKTSSSQSSPIITDTSYEDENIKITIETVREYNTTFYVADIQLSDVSYLKTAFADNTYGRNYKALTSAIAENNNAIFAINGDYYGFRNYGYVLRNGVLYRDTVSDNDALVIDGEGDFSIIDEDNTSAQSIADSCAWQVFSFGPALINNSKITVTANSEVDQSMSTNPRTAIGQISKLHYLVIVSDGRTSASEGLSLLELAQKFAERGCTVAYNLDGGGSSTMWFNGEVINNPTTNGKTISERSVSDIVYIGY